MTTEALPTTLLISATVASGLVAGLLYGFACAVMPGLKEVDDRAFVGAMQSINRRILNGWFLLTFVGSPMLTVGAGVAAFVVGDRGSAGCHRRRRCAVPVVGRDHRFGERAARTTRWMRRATPYPAPASLRSGLVSNGDGFVATSRGRWPRQRRSAGWSGRWPVVAERAGSSAGRAGQSDHRPAAAERGPHRAPARSPPRPSGRPVVGRHRPSPGRPPGSRCPTGRARWAPAAEPCSV